MTLFLDIVAWASIVLQGFAILLLPLFIGRSRPNYGYSNFIAALIEFVMVALLSARVLGYI